MSEIIKDTFVYTQHAEDTEIPINLDESGVNLIREGAEVQLGKRFVCALGISVPEVFSGKLVRRYISGIQTTKDGRSVDFGCGQQILVTKASEGRLTCCDKEMTLETPVALPSSD